MQELKMRARVQYQGDLLTGPIRMLVILDFPTRVRGDWDNVAGSISDALQGIVYLSDKQVVDGHVLMFDGEGYEGIEVHVSQGPARRPR